MRSLVAPGPWLARWSALSLGRGTRGQEKAHHRRSQLLAPPRAIKASGPGASSFLRVFSCPSFASTLQDSLRTRKTHLRGPFFFSLILLEAFSLSLTDQYFALIRPIQYPHLRYFFPPQLAVSRFGCPAIAPCFPDVSEQIQKSRLRPLGSNVPSPQFLDPLDLLYSDRSLLLCLPSSPSIPPPPLLISTAILSCIV